MRTLAFASTIALLGLTSTAEAHFVLMTPLPSNPADQVGNPVSDNPSGKGSPPCGPDTVAAAMPTAAQGGHPLMLKLQEVVQHDGFYRVALAINSRSEIPVDNVVYDSKGNVLPPTGKPGGMSARADSETSPVFPVLGDDLFPHPSATYKTVANQTFMGSVMLPNINCDRCILQVIEYMNGHPFNPSTPGPGGGYFYHHCAELKITADPALPLFNQNADGGTADASSGTAGDAGIGAGGNGGASSTGGATGTAGSQSAGAAGTGGQAGSPTGTAGATTPGSAGDTGATTGSAGNTTATGAAGSRASGGSGGCAVVGLVDRRSTAATTFALLGLALLVRSRRRR
jgi:hypothetical protein